MNVLLIQPPDPAQGFNEEYQVEPAFRHLSPDWDLLCMMAFIRKRTQFFPHYIDTRLFFDLRKDLLNAIREIGSTRFAVVKTTCLSLGPVAAVLDILKRYHPEIHTVICGEYPSQFPDKAAIMPRVDYALSGDPEPIFQALLRHHDFPQRLRIIKGLIRGNSGESAKPQWLKNLHTLYLPTWDDVFINAYQSGFRNPKLHFHIRLSRGHSHTPADRAAPSMSEPLRTWDINRLAHFVKESAGRRVSQVIMTDPPGFWTQGRLEAWCQSLKRINNYQPWRLQLLPVNLDDDQLELLAASACAEVNFVFPNCRQDLLDRYGCEINRKEIARMVRELQARDIFVRAHFWLGGPEDPQPDPRRITNMIKALDFLPYSLHPFPFHLDSFLYRELKNEHSPHIDQWVEWASNPWLIEQPAPYWNGPSEIESVNRQAHVIHQTMKRSPARLFSKFAKTLQYQPWYRSIENLLLDTFAAKQRSH